MEACELKACILVQHVFEGRRMGSRGCPRDGVDELEDSSGDRTNQQALPAENTSHTPPASSKIGELANYFMYTFTC